MICAVRQYNQELKLYLQKISASLFSFGNDGQHTILQKNIWKHLKKALPEYRRKIKPTGEKEKNPEPAEFASELWKQRRSLLKKPSNPGKEEREQIEHLEKRDTGFIKKFRSVIRQIANISDCSKTEKQAENVETVIRETKNI